MTSSTFYRAGVGLAIVAALLTLWIMGAVGIVGAEGARADLLFVAALGIGVVGAAVARLRARGMARAMAATAVGLVLAGVVALAGGLVPAYNSAAEVVGLSVGFAALFASSARLFARAG